MPRARIRGPSTDERLAEDGERRTGTSDANV